MQGTLCSVSYFSCLKKEVALMHQGHRFYFNHTCFMKDIKTYYLKD